MTKSPDPRPRARAKGVSPGPASQALGHMRALLPSYREICGAAPYYYAMGEIQRLEHQLIQIHSSEELEHITRQIEAQLTGLAHAIREAKGRGADLDG